MFQEWTLESKVVSIILEHLNCSYLKFFMLFSQIAVYFVSLQATSPFPDFQVYITFNPVVIQR